MNRIALAALFFALATPLAQAETITGMTPADKQSALSLGRSFGAGQDTPGSNDMQQSAQDTLGSMGVAVPLDMTMQTPANGSLDTPSSISISQAQTFKVALSANPVTADAGVCAGADRCAQVTGSPVTVNLPGSSLLVSSLQPLTLRLCDSEGQGGQCVSAPEVCNFNKAGQSVCKPNDWSAWTGEVQVDTGEQSLSGSPLTDTWRLSASCTAGDCTLKVVHQYSLGGAGRQLSGGFITPTNGGNMNAMLDSPVGQDMLALRSSDAYKEALGTGAGGTARLDPTTGLPYPDPKEGEFQADADCAKSRRAMLENGGLQNVPVRCGADNTYGTVEVDAGDMVSGDEGLPANMDPDSDNGFSQVAMAANLADQLTRYGEPHTDGTITLFTGKASTCKKVNGMFQEWMRVDSYINPIIASVVDADRLECCGDDPQDIDIAANMGYCKQDEQDLAASRMAGAAHMVEKGTPLSKSLCGTLSEIGGGGIGGGSASATVPTLTTPLIGDRLPSGGSSFTGWVENPVKILEWATNMVNDAKVCGVADGGMRTMSQWVFGWTAGSMSAGAVVVPFHSLPYQLMGEQAFKTIQVPFGTLETWCTFPSMLARIIQEQGRPQVNELATQAAVGAANTTVNYAYFGGPSTFSYQETPDPNVVPGFVDVQFHAGDATGAPDLADVAAAQSGWKPEFATAVINTTQTQNGSGHQQQRTYDFNAQIGDYTLKAAFTSPATSNAGGPYTYSQTPVICDAADNCVPFVKQSNPAQGQCAVGEHAIVGAAWCAVVGDDIVYTKADWAVDAFINLFATYGAAWTFTLESVNGVIKPTNSSAPWTGAIWPKNDIVLPNLFLARLVDNPPDPNAPTTPVDTYQPVEVAAQWISKTVVETTMTNTQWTPVVDVNGNKVSFWQWASACELPEAGATAGVWDAAALKRASSIEESHDCPVSQRTFVAVCAIGACGPLPANPYVNKTEWLVMPLDPDDSTTLTPVTRYVLVQGGCTEGPTDCSYKVSGLPHGAGGQLHVQLPIQWSLHGFGGPAGGRWDPSTVVNHNQVWFEAYTWPKPEEGEADPAKPRLRMCLGGPDKCNPAAPDNSADWTEIGGTKVWHEPVPANPGSPAVPAVPAGYQFVSEQTFQPTSQVEIPCPSYFCFGTSYTLTFTGVPGMGTVTDVYSTGVGMGSVSDLSITGDICPLSFAQVGFGQCVVAANGKAYFASGTTLQVGHLDQIAGTPAIPEVPATPEVPGYWEVTGGDLPAKLDLPGMSISDAPKILLSGGGCTPAGCAYNADIWLKIEAMPWLDSPDTYDNIDIELWTVPLLDKSGYADTIRWNYESHPNCEGFTLDQFLALDFGKIDLSEYANSLTGKAKEQFERGFLPDGKSASDYDIGTPSWEVPVPPPESIEQPGAP